MNREVASRGINFTQALRDAMGRRSEVGKPSEDFGMNVVDMVSLPDSSTAHLKDHNTLWETGDACLRSRGLATRGSDGMDPRRQSGVQISWRTLFMRDGACSVPAENVRRRARTHC